MASVIPYIDGFVERCTITGAFVTRVLHIDETFFLNNAGDLPIRVAEGSLIMVVGRVDSEQPLVEFLLDRAECDLHNLWSRYHAGEETRTPFDLRTPEAGGREDEPLPF